MGSSPVASRRILQLAFAAAATFNNNDSPSAFVETNGSTDDENY
jgi:hypothetical protein